MSAAPLLMWVAVAVAGSLGAAARYLVDVWVSGAVPGRLRSLPVGIALVNVTGSFAIGIVAAVFAGDDAMRVVLATGFCGGYTTFSTAMVDTVRLARAGRYVAAVGHAVGTLTVSVAAVALGAWLITALRR